ncbi:MAG: cytochrome c maturation protein CcmE [Pseudomonadota bacterium]
MLSIQAMKAIKIMATVAVFAGGTALVVSQSAEDVEYFVHVEQVVERPADWIGKGGALHVHGYVVPGSIEERHQGGTAERVFELERQGKTIPVRHRGSVPDLFKDQAELVVKGTIVSEDGRPAMVARDGRAGLIVKCPSKYQARRDQR